MKSLLKFITCGSVDDGKSTLIGHMLYDAKLLFADQEQALKLDSKIGSRNGAIDYSLLLDGLMAEREQGITIDVAYRYFTTDKRSFIVADTPGHEEYTRNMAVGASFADLAVILVDASLGILVQTRRHARICALMGIRHFVFAINKMDLINYDKEKFLCLEKDIRKLSVELNLEKVKCIPVSATEGDNVTEKSENMPWYDGESLLNYLENIDIETNDEVGFVMPVQRVCRPDRTFRGYQGEVESGIVSVGEEITVLPSGEKALVRALLNGDSKVDTIISGMPVTMQLDREIDISRGCVVVKGTELHVSSMFTATLLWMDDKKLVEGRNFLLKLATQRVPATIMKIKYKVDVNSGNHVPARSIFKNEIAVCDIALAKKTVFDKFASHRVMGEFIMIDRISNMTSACGVIDHSLRRSDNLTWQKTDLDREIRSAKMNQKPMTLWFTGLSGAGKSSLANAVEKILSVRGNYTMLLDGDNVRLGLNKNLGFEEDDRAENIRRIAEVAKLMNDAGLIVLTSFISPYKSDRRNAKEIIGEESFVEIYVSTPLEECEKRDVKGLYKKARKGDIPNFTGINSPYELPENPDIAIDTNNFAIEEAAEYVVKELERYL
ncbi:adenylyl-sulfate kinase [Butyrivibrio sp. CB08]|uniref:adenylyl-sulfate kinase n=1 Tax=Butyrivibrio sp. CB08 TaxID=2364879 RepID=UPI000EAA126C|nr:adenylyl-sulfate kinase [Butyrivibrio sp. CB08]RKM57873.1 adenylyl-sulfate kinase [Butyrivibrio sp. CB08]